MDVIFGTCESVPGESEVSKVVFWVSSCLHKKYASLPPAYVVRREGNVLTRVCPSICLSTGGGGGSVSLLSPGGGVVSPAGGGVSPAGGGQSSWGGVSPAGGGQSAGGWVRSVSWVGGGSARGGGQPR